MDRPLRIVTLNIAHGRGLSLYQGFHTSSGIRRQLSRITRLFSRLAPDIVCLQEVDEASHWNSHLNLYEILKEEGGFPHGFMGVHNRRSGPRPLAYGNAILSKHPLAAARVVPFGENSLGEKGFLHADIETPAGLLPMVNIHLAYQSRRRRLEQLESLIHYLHDLLYPEGRKTSRPPLICGDFNARAGRRGDAVSQLFGYVLSHHEYRVYPESGKTFPAHRPLHGIDFALVPEPWKVENAEILRAYVSDHRPVVIDLTLRPG